MKNRTVTAAGVVFTIGNYCPRRNEFERGLKYQVFKRVIDGACVRDGVVSDDFIFIPTGAKFSTIAAAKQWIKDNAIYLK